MELDSENAEKETIALIFERKIVEESDEKIVYSYMPCEVAYGIENISDNGGTFTFNADGDEYTLQFIENASELSERYVYAFPKSIEKDEEINLNEYIERLESLFPILKDKILFQVYNKNDQLINTFILNDDINAAINIDTTDLYGIYDIVYKDYSYLSTAAKEIEKNKEQLIQENEVNYKTNDIIYSDDLYEKTKKTVISQDEQIKKIATIIAKNSRITNQGLKSSMIICGPAGVGKTEIFKTISKNINVPLVIEDSTEYTSANERQKDVEEILFHLITNANGNILKAQKGIVVFDDLDKSIINNLESIVVVDNAINSIIKMMNGNIYYLNYNDNLVEFDTSKLTFIFMGAFEKSDNYIEDVVIHGFSCSDDKKEETPKYSIEYLAEYGLLPKLLDSNDNIIIMNDLDTPDFEKILKESNKSELLLYKKLLEENGIKFTYSDETIEAIAKKAKELGLGAKSLKQIVENTLSIANYEMFSKNNYSELIITPETVENNNVYTLR